MDKKNEGYSAQYTTGPKNSRTYEQEIIEQSKPKEEGAKWRKRGKLKAQIGSQLYILLEA